MSSSTADTVTTVLTYLKERLADNAYKLWIDPLEFDCQGSTLLVSAPNQLHLDEFKNRHLRTMTDSLEELGLAGLVVRCDVRPVKALETRFPVQVAREAVQRETGAARPALDVNAKLTFDEFIVGPDNQMAFASSQAVARQPGGQFNPLFVYGDTGLGKTHLLQAIYNFIRAEHPQLKCVYTNCETFTNDFIEAIKQHTLDTFRATHREVDVLIVDDIQFLSGKDSTQEEFFHTFNDLVSVDKQVIVSSDSAPADLQKFEHRLTSRFSSGLVTSIDRPLFETRLSILRQKASRSEIDVPSTMIEELASLPIDNIRELNGALTTLSAHLSFSTDRIDGALVRKLFPQYSSQSASAKTSIDYDDVIGLVTERYGVRLQDLQSDKRKHSILVPRQVAMYLLRRLTSHTLEEIGAYFGGRDHSTVQHAQAKIEKQRKSDSRLHEVLLELETSLKGGDPAWG